jgi:hypothetical protein
MQKVHKLNQARLLYVSSASRWLDALARVHLDIHCERESFSDYEKDDSDEGAVPLLIHVDFMSIPSAHPQRAQGQGGTAPASIVKHGAVCARAVLQAYAYKSAVQGEPRPIV